MRQKGRGMIFPFLPSVQVQIDKGFSLIKWWMTSPLYLPRKPKQVERFAKYTEGSAFSSKNKYWKRTKRNSIQTTAPKKSFSERMRILLLTGVGRKCTSLLGIKNNQVAMDEAKRDPSLPLVPEWSPNATFPCISTSQFHPGGKNIQADSPAWIFAGVGFDSGLEQC